MMQVRLDTRYHAHYTVNLSDVDLGDSDQCGFCVRVDAPVLSVAVCSRSCSKTIIAKTFTVS